MEKEGRSGKAGAEQPLLVWRAAGSFLLNHFCEFFYFVFELVEAFWRNNFLNLLDYAFVKLLNLCQCVCISRTGFCLQPLSLNNNVIQSFAQFNSLIAVVLCSLFFQLFKCTLNFLYSVLNGSFPCAEQCNARIQDVLENFFHL